MRTIQPTEARKNFFSLGTMAREEILLVTASTPFFVMPVEPPSASSELIPGVRFAPPHPFRLPEVLEGPGGKSLSDLVSEGRR